MGTNDIERFKLLLNQCISLIALTPECLKVVIEFYLQGKKGNRRHTKRAALKQHSF